MKLLSLLLVVVINSSFAELNDDAKVFCEESNINKLSKKKELVKNHVDSIKHIGNVHFATNSNDCELFKSSLTDKNSVVIDARGKGTRGNISGAAKIISDHDEASSHEFNPKTFNKKLSRFLKKKRSMENVDLKSLKLVIFCNGPTCYRTSWAACTLVQNGYSPKNLHLFLDGFLGIKKSCLK